MPVAAFEVISDQKDAIHGFLHTIDESVARLRRGSKEVPEHIQERIRNAFNELDQGYELFVRIAQSYMGLDEAEIERSQGQPPLTTSGDAL